MHALAQSFNGERGAILALYAAKIEATRRSVPARDIAAAVQALRDEQHGALRALARRKQAMLRAGREQRMAERFSDRLANRRQAQETAPAAPDAQPS